MARVERGWVDLAVCEYGKKEVEGGWGRCGSGSGSTISEESIGGVGREGRWALEWEEAECLSFLEDATFERWDCGGADLR